MIIEKIRNLIQELYINLVSMSDLILYIFNTLYTKYNKNNKFIEFLIENTSLYDRLINKGNKESIHVECYVFILIEYIHKNNMIEDNNEDNDEDNEIELEIE